MGNPYPAEFMTQALATRGNVVRIGGLVNFTDPGNQPGGGGGGPSGAVLPVIAASVNNTDVTTSPPSGAATVDGVTIATGDRVLLTAQTVGSDNGVWEANTAGAWTRPSDWTGTVDDGTTVSTGEQGSNYYTSTFMTAAGSPIVVGTTDPEMQLVNSVTATWVTVDGAAPALALQGSATSVNSSVVNIPNLPTADPHVAGQLWNDTGTVKVSAG